MIKHATRTQASQSDFATADEAEITNIELQLSTDDLLNWEETAKIAEKGNFNYIVKFPTSLEVADEALQNCVKLCAVLNTDVLVIHEPMAKKFGKQLAELAPNLKLAVENNRFTAKRLTEWAESHAALALDVEHFWKFTLEDGDQAKTLELLTQFIRAYGQKIAAVHISGYQPGQQVHRPMYCNRDLTFAVLSALAEKSFSGFIVGEVAAEYMNRRDLVMDRELVASWQEQAAVTV